MILLDAVQETVHSRDIHEYVNIYGSLVMSAITFVLGYIVANRISNRKERKELENIKNMFLEYYNSFNESKKIQIENYYEYKKSLHSIENFEVVVELVNVSFNYDFFDALDKVKLYKSLDKSEIDLYEFFSIHSHFKKVNNEMILFYDNFTFSEFTSLKNRFYNTMVKIEEIMSEIFENQNQFSEQEIDTLRKTHTNPSINSESPLKNVKDEYLEVLYEVLVYKYNKTNGTLKYLADFSKVIKEGISLIDKFDSLKQDAINYISMNIKQLQVIDQKS